MLTAAYHMPRNEIEYKNLGAEHFTRRDREKMIQRLVRRIDDLGCQVQLIPRRPGECQRNQKIKARASYELSALGWPTHSLLR